MKLINTGSTRLVILTKSYAFKIPRLNKWKDFLNGLLSNLQEIDFNKLNEPKLCPVLFSLPLGLLVIMPKCRILRDFEMNRKQLEEYCKVSENFILPCEYKEDSFGYYKGKLVCVDYGN